jgi:hypothetical protein
MHVVCDWIGNSEKVAVAHYLQVVEADFDKATQKATHHPTDSSCTEQHAAPAAAVSAAFPKETTKTVPPAGIEPATYGLGNRRSIH